MTNTQHKSVLLQIYRMFDEIGHLRTRGEKFVIFGKIL